MQNNITFVSDQRMVWDQMHLKATSNYYYEQDHSLPGRTTVTAVRVSRIRQSMHWWKPYRRHGLFHD